MDKEDPLNQLMRAMDHSDSLHRFDIKLEEVQAGLKSVIDHLEEENLTIHMENGSRIVMVGSGQAAVRGRSMGGSMPFPDTFNASHALAYQPLDLNLKAMQAMAKELYAPKPKSPKQVKDDLHSFLKRKDGRQKGRRW